MYDIGFQNLSRMMMSGKPIKVLILDTQVYSNTGGQACTSGFTGQVSDMAQYGKAFPGQRGSAQGDRAGCDGAPHNLRGAGQHFESHAPDRKLHRRHQREAAGAVQYV
jgi:hypothetical protein